MKKRSPKKHLRLDEGMVASNMHHAIWLTPYICNCLVLHKEGKPGVVATHRVSTKSRIDVKSAGKLNRSELARLKNGEILSPRIQANEPKKDDTIDLMAHAARSFGKKQRKLSIILPTVEKEGDGDRSAIEKVAKRAQERGLISSYDVIPFKDGQHVRVVARNGRIKVEENQNVPTAVNMERAGTKDKLAHNLEWEE